MPYPQFQHDLNTALESEILGEQAFLSASKYSRSADQQQKWKYLAQLETQTLHKLQEFLVKQGQNASSRAHIKFQAKVTGIVMAKLPWKVTMYLLKRGTQPFMLSFERMNRHVDQNTQDFLMYLLAHEKALAEFATRELKGQKKTSLEPVLALLDKP